MDYLFSVPGRPSANILPLCEFCQMVAPAGIKSVWPDGYVYTTNYEEADGYSNDILRGTLEVFDHLGIRRLDSILDIGAKKNILVNGLQREGYVNATGIDKSDVILSSRFGRQMNFRDLPLDERYKVIHFCAILDFFPGGSFNDDLIPSLDLLAAKLYLHTEPKGYLVFKEVTKNLPEFKEALRSIGFKPVLEYLHYPRVWQKA